MCEVLKAYNPPEIQHKSHKGKVNQDKLYSQVHSQIGSEAPLPTDQNSTGLVHVLLSSGLHGQHKLNHKMLIGGCTPHCKLTKG